MNRLAKLSTPAKACVNSILRRFGLEIRRTRRYRAYGWLRGWGICTVLDIGANVGQFASLIHGILPEARLYSFEPLDDCYQQLAKRMGHVKTFVGFKLALGDKNGREQIYRNDYTPSSSLLPVDDLLTKSFPFASSVTPQEIEIRRLDDLACECALVEPILMKIDVQGLEDKVILGAERVLGRTSVVIVETSFKRLYKGQALFDQIYRLLSDRGFIYMGSEHDIRNPKDGTLLQSDAVFLRKGESTRGVLTS